MTKNSGKNSGERLSENEAFQWNQKRSDVALSLSQGYTWKETAEKYGISETTIANWKKHPDFAAEVDRLSLMVDIAGRAQRLRIAMRIVRDKGFKSDKDLLEWLKFAQSETDGVKLDLAALAEAASPVAGGGSGGAGPTPGNRQPDAAPAGASDPASSPAAD